jgi:hypothetical protein
VVSCSKMIGKHLRYAESPFSACYSQLGIILEWSEEFCSAAAETVKLLPRWELTFRLASPRIVTRMWRNPTPLPSLFISFVRFGNLLESMFDRWLFGADYRVFTCVFIVRTAGRNAAYYCSLVGDEPAFSLSSHPSPEPRNILETDSTNERIICKIPQNGAHEHT